MNVPRAILEWARESPVLAILVALLIGLIVVFLIVGVFDPAWVRRFFGVETGTGKFRILEFIGVGMGGVLLAIGATIAHRRARAMEDAANAQAKAVAQQTVANEGAEDGRRQERLKNAIEHLGHESDSVRLGGAYELFHLAQDTEDLRQTVMDILCAHIRRTTGEAGYRETHKEKPSTEVQSLLTLLFVRKHAVFRGCRIDLQESWLNGAELAGAYLCGAFLDAAYLRRATLVHAYLQGVTFIGTEMQNSYITNAHMQGSTLMGTELQGAQAVNTYFQGAILHVVDLNESNINNADFRGITLPRSGGFSNLILDSINKESDLTGIIFGQENNPQTIRVMLEKAGAIIGAYTEEEAERWIAEYNEATGRG